jgi:AraC-like DNA-binding protein
MVMTSSSAPGDRPRVFVIGLPKNVLEDVMARAHSVTSLQESPLAERFVHEMTRSAESLRELDEPPSPAGPSASRQAMLDQAMAFIEEHLENEHLSPAMVAAGIFVSKRYLYMLFQQEPRSVSRHIILRRLEVIARRLLDPRWSHLSVSDLVMRMGFKNPSHAARAFKAEYGTTPGRFRAERQLMGAA